MPLLPEDVRRYAKSLYQRLEDSGATVADGVNVANALDEMVVARAAQTAGRHPEEVSLALSYEEKEKLRESALQELRERIDRLKESDALDFTTAFHLRATLDGMGTHLLKSPPSAPAAVFPAAEFNNSSVFLDASSAARADAVAPAEAPAIVIDEAEPSFDPDGIPF